MTFLAHHPRLESSRDRKLPHGIWFQSVLSALRSSVPPFWPSAENFHHFSQEYQLHAVGSITSDVSTHPSSHPSCLPTSHPSVLAECLLLRGHLLGTTDTGKQNRALVNLVFPWPPKCTLAYKPFFKCALILLFPKWKTSSSHNISILTESMLGLKYHFLYPEGTQKIFTVHGKIKSLIRWIEISSLWEHLVGMSTNVLWTNSSDLEIPFTQSFIIFLRERFCTFITLFFISFKLYFLWWNWDI